MKKISQYVTDEAKKATQNKTQVSVNIQGIDLSLIRGPSVNITLHDQYDAANDMYILVGQKTSLLKTMKENVYTIIEYDMRIFNLGIFLLNFVLYLVVIFILER